MLGMAMTAGIGRRIIAQKDMGYLIIPESRNTPVGLLGRLFAERYQTECAFTTNAVIALA
jgi:hypothetical protein